MSQPPTLNISSDYHNAHSNTYDRMAGNSTANIAIQFLPLITPLITSFSSSSSTSSSPSSPPPSYILDLAAGTGIISTLIKEQCPEARIKATDLAPKALEILREKMRARGWEGVETEVLDNSDLRTLGDGTFTHVIMNFGLGKVPEGVEGPLDVMREIYRVLKPGGVAVVTSWAERNFTKAFERAARELFPNDEPFTWPAGEWDEGWWLMKQLSTAGFGHKVEVRSLNGQIEAPTLDQLVENLLLFKDMFFGRYTDEQLVGLKKAITSSIKALDAFEEDEDQARIKMVAWVGMAWK